MAAQCANARRWWGCSPSIGSSVWAAPFPMTRYSYHDRTPGSLPPADGVRVPCKIGGRELSLLRAMEELLKPDTFDSWDVLMRAYMETLDLLSTFRFDDEAARAHIEKWFAEKAKDVWEADHKKIELFLTGAGAYDLKLGRQWGIFSGLSHPTTKTPHNSAHILSRITLSADRQQDLSQILREKPPTIAILSDDCS
jgi:hypothetical protein